MKKIIIVIIVGLCLVNSSVFAAFSDAQLKLIDQPIELCRENRKKLEYSIPKDLLWTKISDILGIMGNGKDSEKNKKTLNEYNKLIKENPDKRIYRS